jgi:hypothetical protein
MLAAGAVISADGRRIRRSDAEAAFGQVVPALDEAA